MDINRYTPTYNLKQKHLLNISDYSAEEIFEILYATRAMKAKFASNEQTFILRGTTIALLFGDTSLRMRSAIEIGVRQLGGDTIDLPYSEEDMNAGENMADIVNAISRYGVGALFTRGISAKDLHEYCNISSIPIINSHNASAAPLQAAADLFTIWEKMGRLEGVKIAYIGKASPVAQSLALSAVKCGMTVSMALPPHYNFSREELNNIRQFGSVLITDDPVEATKDADIVYTDSYHYHMTTSQSERDLLKPYQVNMRLMASANRGAFFMHPLPATRGNEVTADIIDGKSSVVYDQAENRLHTVKAVVALLVK